MFTGASNGGLNMTTIKSTYYAEATETIMSHSGKHIVINKGDRIQLSGKQEALHFKACGWLALNSSNGPDYKVPVCIIEVVETITKTSQYL